MQKLFGPQSDDSEQGNKSLALEMIDALYNLEMRANIMALRQEQRKARLQRSLGQWAEYWPMAVGILISVIAPQIREVADTLKPWGLWVSFPMVALFTRPEVHLSGRLAAMAPTAMLYLQFPVEGLLAKFALKGHVTPYAVMVQVIFFHGLCIMDLWILNGGLWQVFAR
jgi:hypothetical protein